MYVFETLLVLTIQSTFISASEVTEILSKFNQGDYKLKFERANLVSYDKAVYSYMEGKSFKYNRTTTVVNATLMLNENLEDEYIEQIAFERHIYTPLLMYFYILVQAYKFLSNEYRHFPIRFQINYCKAFAANAIGIQSKIKCGNITGCPLQKGVLYHVCHFAPEEAKLPPLIPSGSYMLELTVLYKDKPAALVQGYGTIWRPVV